MRDIGCYLVVEGDVVEGDNNSVAQLFCAKKSGVGVYWDGIK